MLIPLATLQIRHLRRHRLPEQHPLQPRCIRRDHPRLIHAVQHPWDGGEERRLEDLGVFEEAEVVSAKVADAAGDGEGGGGAEALCDDDTC